MTTKEKAIAIVREMVEEGYHLFNETIEQFAQRMGYDVEMLKMFKANYERYLSK